VSRYTLSRPGWFLIFRRGGYASEEVDVSPHPKKEGPTRIIAVVYLRPAERESRRRLSM